MYKMQVVIMAMAAVVSAVHCAVFPAGKCKTHHIEPIPIDFHELAGYEKLNILYATEVDGIEKVDHTDLVYKPRDKESYSVVNTKYLKDKTTEKQTYFHSSVDNVILEDGTDAGKPFHFHLYPIAKSKEGAILFYRCADAGRQPVDTRFICIPDGKTLSDASFKQLIAEDKKLNFIGSFYKFPNQLP